MLIIKHLFKMYSNYNVLTLSMEADGKYSIGDTYKVPERPVYDNWRHRRFKGLKIVNIDYCFGVRLHFDWSEWEQNKPK